MILGSYEMVNDGIEFEPFAFRGHGWLYSHETDDQTMIDKLLAKPAVHQIPEGSQKKNVGSIIFKPTGNTNSNPRPARKRGCCGGGSR